MRIAVRLGLVGAVLALTSTLAAAAATPVRLVEAGGVTFPDRAYILTLPHGEPLSTSDLRVTENGSRVSNLRVSRQGSATQSRSAVVLVLDASNSMKGKPIRDAVAAARAFAARRAVQQELAIVTFNGSVNVLQGFSTDSGAIASTLAKTPELVIGTKLYDALNQSLDLIAAAHVPTASIVLLTDGTDVGSQAQPAAVLKRLRSAHVRVFSVGLVSKTFDQSALEDIATVSRGSFVRAEKPSQLSPIYAALGQRLANEYLLTYRSRQNPGTNVGVSVRVAGIPEAAKAAYVAPELHIAPPAPYKASRSGKIVESPILMLALVLVIVGLVGLAVWNLFKSRSKPLVERVGGFVSVRPTRAPAPSTINRPAAAATNFLTRQRESVRRLAWTERLRATLDLAGITLTPVQLVLLTIAGTLLAILILNLILGPIGILFGLVAVPWAARALVLGTLARKRRTFAEQLPDNLDVLASALRSGHSLIGALRTVADDAAEPSKSEFNRVLAEEQFGVQLEDALKVTVERMENSDLDQVALVARLQREMGSNSAEVLDRIVETVRARMELRRLVRTLTAQGRLSRWILTGLPIGLGLFMSILNHGYMKPLFDTGLGRFLLVLAVGMVALGSVIIGKLIDIKA